MNINKKLKEYRYIKTEKEAMEAVKQDGYALRYVKILIEEKRKVKISEIQELLGFKIEIVEG